MTLRISPPLTLEGLRRVMVVDTGWSVVGIVAGVRSRGAAAAVVGVVTLRGRRTARVRRCAERSGLHDTGSERLVDLRRIGCRCSLFSIPELSKGPLDLAEESLEGSDGGVDLGRSRRRAVAVHLAVSVRETVPIRCTGPVGWTVRLTDRSVEPVTVGVATIPAVLARISQEGILGLVVEVRSCCGR